jgi:protein gp37
LFHPDIPNDYIIKVAKTMSRASWHTYQVLTKRSERLCDLLKNELSFAAEAQHIWWGVSVENRRHGLPRCEQLRQTNAKMKFLSVEPLIEDLGDFSLDGIDWVIVGGESGAGARPIKKEWVRSVRRLCRKFKVPFFFKQWGGVRKKEAGRVLDGRTYDEMPTIKVLPAPTEASRQAMITETESENTPVYQMV